MALARGDVGVDLLYQSRQTAGELEAVADPSLARLLPRHPPTGAVWAWVGGLGGAAVLWAFYWIAKMTDAYVWEGSFNPGRLFVVWGLLYFGITVVLMLISDSAKAAYGSTARAPRRRILSRSARRCSPAT